jgi:chorismate mutase
MRRSSRRHHQEQQQKYRHSAHNLSLDKKKNQEEQNVNERNLKGLDVSHDALQSLLNSRFKVIDLVDLLKKTYPKLLSNDQKRELQFIQQLSQTNTGKKKNSFSFFDNL